MAVAAVSAISMHATMNPAGETPARTVHGWCANHPGTDSGMGDRPITNHEGVDPPTPRNPPIPRESPVYVGSLTIEEPSLSGARIVRSGALRLHGSTGNSVSKPQHPASPAKGSNVKRPVRTASLVIGAAALLFTTVACGSNEPASTTTTAEATSATGTATPAAGTVVDVAASAGSFTVLTQLLTAAGLDETLSGPGPFTVFAPTDAAFEALAAGLGVSLDDAVKGLIADPELLTAALLYHVVPGKIPAADVVALNGQAVETLTGETWTVIVNGETVSIEDGFGRIVKVIDVDVPASNGVIHVIDNVLEGAEPAYGTGDQSLEPDASNASPYDPAFDGSASQTIVEDLAAAGNFTVLIELLTAGEQLETLSGPGPFTVFAPTDAAFEAIAAQMGVPLDELVNSVSISQLVDAVSRHVVSGKITKGKLEGMNGQELKTLEGLNVTVIVDGNTISLKDKFGRIANVIDANVVASNGVIHVLDNVLA